MACEINVHVSNVRTNEILAIILSTIMSSV